MKQLFLCHLHYVFSLLYQTHSASLYLYLFWRANQMSKSRRFVGRTLAVFYGAFLQS
jgi:hypothetical protein